MFFFSKKLPFSFEGLFFFLFCFFFVVLGSKRPMTRNVPSWATFARPTSPSNWKSCCESLWIRIAPAKWEGQCYWVSVTWGFVVAFIFSRAMFILCLFFVFSCLYKQKWRERPLPSSLSFWVFGFSFHQLGCVWPHTTEMRTACACCWRLLQV